MNVVKKCTRGLLITAAAAFSVLNFAPAFAVDKAALNLEAKAALQSLYDNEPKAKEIGNKSAGVLVFPDVTRAGLIIGGSGGHGVLYEKGKAVGYYSSGSASIGLQAGVQTFGYAVFFVTDVTLRNFKKASGWDIGAAPTVVLVDAGAAKNLNTTTLKSEVYAFIFNQEGVMAGIALQGQKISKLK
jgi:lipid-binding SYLF domain-containing protein